MTRSHAAAKASAPVPAAAPPLRAPGPAAQPVARPLRSLSAIPAVARKCDACDEAERARTPVMPRLKVGAVNDPHERDADRIADHVMAMRADTAAASDSAVRRQEEEEAIQAKRATVRRQEEEEEVQARRDTVRRQEEEEEELQMKSATVARACATCSGDETARRATEEDTDEAPRMRERTPRADGTETLAASASELTSGGRPLPEATRRFFEPRMGRDLGDVRVHEGAGADALNAEISARAFTYRNHIWLSHAETARPTHTMAHELAHVLQQTAPGPVGPTVRRQPAARAAAPTVQRDHWQPWGTSGVKGGARAHSQTHHDRLQVDLADANKPLLTEVRNSAASSSSRGHMACGFADLYRTDTKANGKMTVPGVEIYYTKPEGATTSDRNFRNVHPAGNCRGTWFTADDRKAAYAYAKGQQRPLINNTNTQNPTYTKCDEAPTNIKLGDVKPGHNERERAKGVDQLKNYIHGLNTVADYVNDPKKSSSKPSTPPPGPKCWTPSPSIMGRGFLTIPSTWDPARGGESTWDIPSLEFRRSTTGSGKSFRPMHSWKKGNKNSIRGRYSAVEDPNNEGIWVYFVEPHPGDLEKAMEANEAAQPAFKRGADKLEPILKCLQSNPASSGVSCKRDPVPFKNRPVRRRKVIARRTAPGLRRKKTARPVPKDKFDVKAWNATRMGSKNARYAKESKDNLKSLLDKGVSKDQRALIAFRGAVAEGASKYEKSFGPKARLKLSSKARSKKAGGPIDQARTLEKMEFWSSASAGIFGQLRGRFGALFAKAMASYQKLRVKIAGAFKKAQMKSRRSSKLVRAALKAAKTVLVSLGQLTMNSVSDFVMDSLQKGISEVMQKQIAGAGLDDLNARALVAQEQIKSIKDGVFDDVEALATKTIAPIEAHLKVIGSAVSVIGRIVMAANLIARGIRVGTCVSGAAAGGVGAAVTCVLAGADLIASVFDASPIDHIAAKVLQSCTSRKKIAAAMVGTAAIRDLPTQLGRIVVHGLRGMLPAEVRDIFADPDKMTAAPLNPADYDCKDGAGGSGTGGGGGSTSGTGGTGEAKKGGKTTAGTPAGDGEEGTTPAGKKSTGGGGPSVIKVENPESLGKDAPMKNAGMTIYMVSGIDPKNPPAKDSRVSVVIEAFIGGYLIKMPQEIVFDRVVDTKRGKGVMAYFPEAIRDKAIKKGPYVLEETADGQKVIMSLNRGPSNLYLLEPARGAK
jgi:hypothetical protein